MIIIQMESNRLFTRGFLHYKPGCFHLLNIAVKHFPLNLLNGCLFFCGWGDHCHRIHKHQWHPTLIIVSLVCLQETSLNIVYLWYYLVSVHSLMCQWKYIICDGWGNEVYLVTDKALQAISVWRNIKRTTVQLMLTSFLEQKPFQFRFLSDSGC